MRAQIEWVRSHCSDRQCVYFLSLLQSISATVSRSGEKEKEKRSNIWVRERKAQKVHEAGQYQPFQSSNSTYIFQTQYRRASVWAKNREAGKRDKVRPLAVTIKISSAGKNEEYPDRAETHKSTARSSQKLKILSLQDGEKQKKSTSPEGFLGKCWYPSSSLK